MKDAMLISSNREIVHTPYSQSLSGDLASHVPTSNESARAIASLDARNHSEEFEQVNKAFDARAGIMNIPNFNFHTEPTSEEPTHKLQEHSHPISTSNINTASIT